jgi:hypothetical protein
VKNLIGEKMFTEIRKEMTHWAASSVVENNR